MRSETSEKVPHVVGKSSELTWELIDGLGNAKESCQQLW
jgi:hypothetical protein